jgi:hypothetical protein
MFAIFRKAGWPSRDITYSAYQAIGGVSVAKSVLYVGTRQHSRVTQIAAQSQRFDSVKLTFGQPSCRQSSGHNAAALGGARASSALTAPGHLR